MIQNYSQLIERISKSSGMAAEEIDRRVEAKRAKLSGLISKEGAAQIVASELGINFEKEKMKISELLPGMKRVNIIGKVIKLFPVRNFSKNGREGKVVSMIIADETANIRTALWDTNHIQLIESKKIKEGDVVEISNASIRNTELHLTNFSGIKPSLERIEDVKTEKMYFDRKISDFVSGENIRTRAVIVQMFEPRFFEICPECNKKAIKDAEGSRCEAHGKIMPIKRALLTLVLDDGNSNTRAVMFSEGIEKIGIKEIENTEEFLKKKEELMGDELYFAGNVRQNKVFNTNELIIEDLQQLDVEHLIEQLETKTKG
ncbi:DUF2240 family protein [Candidatus Pacearchaeota archaeon]|nr:DUF2240 family protein [Candidatus Pacearchaeota archaeon]